MSTNQSRNANHTHTEENTASDQVLEVTDLSALSASCVAAWIGSWRDSSRPPCSARRPQPGPWLLDPDASVGHRKLPDCTALFCVSEALTSPLPSLHHTHKNTCVVSSPSSAFATRWEREREAESSEERTLVELYKVRQSKPRPLEISRWICFLTSFSITYQALLPEARAVCSWQSRWWHHAPSANPKPGFTWPKRTRLLHWRPFNKTTFFTKNCSFFTFLDLLHPAMQCV